jgi:DNA-binding LacI/PurR family transcriptional regulator
MPIDFHRPVPLYRQISDDLRSRIVSGALPPGTPVGSQEELAREYSVSLITVKKALADLIREGILFSRVGKGTYVAERAPVFTLTRTRAIGIVLRDLSSPFFSLIVKGVEHAASRAGFTMLLSTSADEAEREEQQIRHFVDLGVSGLVIASMTHVYEATPALRELQRRGVPFVMVSYLSDADIPRVGTDHREGARMATEHLIGLGYRRIAYVNGEEGNLVGEERRIGYERALAFHGLAPDPRYQFRLGRRGEWNDFQSGVEIGEQYSRLAEKPEAFFVYNDLAALGVQQALLAQGVRVPDDVAIVGFDDIGRAQYAPVPLTTVRQPTFEIGVQAVGVIESRMAGGAPQALTILRPELVVRSSCGAHLLRPPKDAATGERAHV